MVSTHHTQGYRHAEYGTGLRGSTRSQKGCVLSETLPTQADSPAVKPKYFAPLFAVELQPGDAGIVGSSSPMRGQASLRHYGSDSFPAAAR
jgi:hypothetical protein